MILHALFSVSLAILIIDRTAAALFTPEPDSRAVLLVSSPTCPFSTAAQTHLDARGVPYRLIDSKRDFFASGLAGWAFQSVRVPIVVVGTEVIHGYRAERIDEALAAIGHPSASLPEGPSGDPLRLREPPPTGSAGE